MIPAAINLPAAAGARPGGVAVDLTRPGWVASPARLDKLRCRAEHRHVLRDLAEGRHKRVLIELGYAAHRFRHIANEAGKLTQLVAMINLVRKAVKMHASVLVGNSAVVSVQEGFDAQAERIALIRSESMFDALLMRAVRRATLEGECPMRVDIDPAKGTVLCIDDNDVCLPVGEDGPDMQPTVWERRWFKERRGPDGLKRYLRVERHRVVAGQGVIEQEAYKATGEKMLINTVPSGTSITVKRGYGSTAAHANSVADDAWLRVLGIAAGEGGAWIDSRETDKGEVKTHCQIFQEAVELTGSLLRSGTDTSDEQAFQRLMAFRRFVENIERSMLFGEATHDKTDAAGKIARTMAGFYEAINTNVANVGGSMTLAAFENGLRPAFDSSPGVKTIYAGSTFMGAIRDLYKDRVRWVAPAQRVGFKVREIETSYGLAQLVYHAGLSGPYAGDAVVIDHSQTELRHLEKDGAPPQTEEHPTTGRVQLWRPNRGTGDATKELWFAEIAPTWGDETAHARFTGVTGASSS